MGVLGGHVSVPARVPAGLGLAGPSGEEARQEAGPGRAGGAAGAGGLPPAPQGRGVRRGPLLRELTRARRRSGAGRPARPAPTTRERTSSPCRGASGRTGASMGRAPARRRDEVGPPSLRSVLAPPSPTPSVGLAPGTCPGLEARAFARPPRGSPPAELSPN